jgi:hypothetical protein
MMFVLPAPQQLSVDFTPMPDLEDFNNVSRIINAVDNAIVSQPDAVSIGFA